MPQESFQWDRKEFYKERKHDRAAERASSPARWRDTPRNRSRDAPRWGSADFRRPPGHGKQGVCHLFHEESGYGFSRNWYEQKMFEDGRFRFPQPSSDGKCNRNGRETKGYSLGFKDYTANSPELSARASGTKPSVNDKRPADDMLMHTSHRQSSFINTREQSHARQQSDDIGTFNDTDTRKGYYRDDPVNTRDWGSLKWTRPGSLSSRGSAFSHSITPRNSGVNVSDAKSISVPNFVIPPPSPSEDALPSTSSTPRIDCSSSRKRQRLGWGEGLAKYERNKECINDCSNTKAESCQSLNSNLADKSPGVVTECVSPATPYSGACSSSPATNDKSLDRTSNLNSGGSISTSPGYLILGGRHINLESLEPNSVSSLSSSLMGLLESEDNNLLEHALVGCTEVNTLLTLKESILNALEATESEIDQLESELKTPTIGSVNSFHSTVSEPSLHTRDDEKPQQFLSGKPSTCQISCDKIMVENAKVQNDDEGCNTTMKDDVMDSPKISKTEHVEPHKQEESFGDLNLYESKDMDGARMDDISGSGAPGLSSDADGVARLSSDADGVARAILKFNRNLAGESSEVFRELLPNVNKVVDISEKVQTNEEIMWRKFASRKRFLHFKERVLSLKFQALLHMWNEDLLSLSARKIRTKSHKKFDLSVRSQSSGCQKLPSSNRLGACFTGNPSSSPTPTDIVDVMKMLLSLPPLRIYREALRMPALILDGSDRAASRFVSCNSLVEDPCAVEKERAMINPWSSDEKKAFIDNLAVFGKNFRKIASFLAHKTTADCVEFYYKNHKSDCFQKKKKLVFRKHQDKSLPTSTYLVTSDKKRNLSASPLSSSAVDVTGRARPGRGRLSGGCRPSWDDGFGADTMGSEREADAADALIGICSMVSSEAASLLRRNSAGFAGGGEGSPTDWTDAEKCSFVQALSAHGKDFTKVARFVRTRSRDQCRIFFGKARNCLQLDSVLGRSRIEEDDEHAVAASTSVVCNTASKEVESVPPGELAGVGPADFPTTLRVKTVNPISTTSKTGKGEEPSPLQDGLRSSGFLGSATSEEPREALTNGNTDTDRVARQGSCLRKCKAVKPAGGLSKRHTYVPDAKKERCNGNEKRRDDLCESESDGHVSRPRSDGKNRGRKYKESRVQDGDGEAGAEGR